MKYHVKSLALAEQGKLRIEWAREKPLKGLTLGACLHVTTETAKLMEVLKAGGASVALCASNPLSTQDDVAASLVKHLKLPVFSIKGESTRTYYRHLTAVLDFRPRITMDDGADLVGTLHGARKAQAGELIGGTEETTTGVIRLRSLADQKKLLFPVIAVNDADTKHFFDNRYGTGQSTIDGILRATNLLFAGAAVVVCGYGQCGRGVSTRAKGMGAHVIVTEVDPLRALEATMDGFQVMPIAEAARVGDVFVTVTGDASVIDEAAFKKMKNGAVVCNAGHFDVEINIKALARMSKGKRRIRPFVDEYTLKVSGKKICLLGEGRLVNLAAAEGHPSMVMDMSFANQALAAEYMVKNHKKLGRQVYPVPKNIDREIARLKLKSLGVKIDVLTAEQEKYLASWEIGT
jgi:adenosylhomocysteinase